MAVVAVIAPSLLQFTDEEGDLIYVKNDIIGIFSKAERTTMADMLGTVRTVKEGPSLRGIISQSTGQWAVRETYEEILAKIAEATCASSE
jgi:hypothetical protein